jgi:hypothetical protein
MSDLKHLLDRALDELPDGTADPAADLRRGQARLRRGRLALGAAPAAAATAVLGVWAAGQLPGPRPAPSVAVTVTSAPRAAAIELVAFHGDQVPGYRVAEVPAGWTIQGGNAYALVLAPEGFPDRSTDSFAGKLVVMLQSEGVALDTSGQPVRIGAGTGWFRVQEDTQLLSFTTAGGKDVVVQAPVSLGWDAARLGQFGAGIEVLVNAQPGQG